MAKSKKPKSKQGKSRYGKTVRSKNSPKKKAGNKRLAKTFQRKRKNNPRRVTKPSRKTKRPIQKSRSARTSRTAKPKNTSRSIGVSVNVRVKSRLLRKDVTILRKETRLPRKSGITLSRSKSKTNEIISKLAPVADRHFDKIGESISDFRLVKFKYEYKLNGKKQTSYFSGKISKFKNKEQMREQMSMALDSFQSRLQNYLSRGFSDIKISGVMVQGYKE